MTLAVAEALELTALSACVAMAGHAAMVAEVAKVVWMNWRRVIDFILSGFNFDLTGGRCHEQSLDESQTCTIQRSCACFDVLPVLFSNPRILIVSRMEVKTVTKGDTF